MSGGGTKCDSCGNPTLMPYKCRYCGGRYCSEHRLPENHACGGLERIRGSPGWGGYAAEVKRRQAEARRPAGRDRWDREEEGRGPRFFRRPGFGGGYSDGTQAMRFYLMAILLISVIAAISIELLWP